MEKEFLILDLNKPYGESFLQHCNQMRMLFSLLRINISLFITG